MKNKLLLLLTIFTFLYSCKTENKSPKPIVDSEKTDQEEKPSVNNPRDLTSEEKISEIKNNYKEVENKLASLEKKNATIEEDNWAPTEVEGFFNNDIPQKITSTEVFGHGSVTTFYYLKEGKLFFVYEASYEEASVHGPFTDREIRMYIKDGELLKALKKERTLKKIVATNLDEIPNIDITNELQDGSELVNKYFAQCSKRKEQLMQAK